MFKKFTPLVLLLLASSAALLAQCPNTPYGSSQVISSNTSWNAGTYTINGDFTVDSGVTLTVNYSGNCPLTIIANNITILGTINANGAGGVGGTGGSGGSSSGGAGGGNQSGGGNGGAAGAGTGGGAAGGNGSGSSGGCSIDCGTFCVGGNDADRAGGGGGAGGAGGAFGAAGGAGGAGAQGRFENEPSNSDCGSTPVAGGGGAGHNSPAAYANTATTADLPTGSGGGGGGGGGGGFNNGTSGGAGGNGGGTVNLDASGNLIVSGSILANGTAGAAGGNGGVRSGNAANWNCESCSNSDGGGANDCRNASDCGACTYYTWSWPGGAGGGAGGGSGGGIKLQATGGMTITGTLQANGGNGGSAGHGNTTDGSCNNYAAGGAAGGGGVIKYVYDPCADNIFNPAQIEATAGTPGTGTDGNVSTNTGSAGTILKETANIYVPGYTPFTALTSYPNQVLCGLGLTPNNINSYSVSGGGGTYTYQWYYSTTSSQGQTGAAPIPLPGWTAFAGGNAASLPGTSIGALNTTTYFQLQITSGPCATWSNVVRVLVDSIPSISNVTVGNVLCNGGSTGTITVTASGGVPGYAYSSDGGSLYSISNVLSGLSQGTYNVYVKDTNNCSSAYANNPVTVNQPALLLFTDSISRPNCSGLSNGSITVNPSGGVTPYQYAINAGVNQPGNSFTGLAAGSYLILLTDSNACTDTATVSLGNAYVFNLAIDTQTNTSCFGNTDGSIVLAASGGIHPYTFSLNDTTFQPSDTFSGLAGGYYVATAHDSAGCQNQLNFEINQAAQMNVQIEAQVNIPCNGSFGQVYIQPLGGTPTYHYIWTNGDTTQNETQLRVGTYGVTITDVHACSASATIDIAFDNAPTATVTTTAATGCYGNANGGATVTATGGATPYVYQWSNGATGTSITNVISGSYIVSVTDFNSCASIDTVVIGGPTAIVANLDTLSPRCNGNTTGMAGVSPTGGTPVYTIAWSTGSGADTITNLAAGSYSVTVSDANSCSAVSSFTLSQPEALSGNLNVVNDSCFGSPDGAATLSVNGGTTPYAYNWSNGATTATASGLSAGTYTVTLNDANLCSFVDTLSITQPTQLVITTASTTANNGDNGTASVTSVSGGVSPYNVRWSNGQITDTISNLAGGTYIVIVSDQNGCERTDTVIVNQLTSVNMVQGDIPFNIYPNPANTSFTIEVSQLNKETTLSIQNVLGQSVYTAVVTSLKTKVDLSGFAEGVYLVELSQGSTKTTKQVVIAK